MTEFDKYYNALEGKFRPEYNTAKNLWNKAQIAALRQIFNPQSIPKVGDTIKLQSLCRESLIEEARIVTEVIKDTMPIYFITTKYTIGNMEHGNSTCGVLGEFEFVDNQK